VANLGFWREICIFGGKIEFLPTGIVVTPPPAPKKFQKKHQNRTLISLTNLKILNFTTKNQSMIFQISKFSNFSKLICYPQALKFSNFFPKI
jgi:hypothetical protein